MHKKTDSLTSTVGESVFLLSLSKTYRFSKPIFRFSLK